MYEFELGIMFVLEEDVYGRLFSLIDFINDYEVVVYEKFLLMDENKFEELRVFLMVEDGLLLYLEKYGNDLMKLEDIVEWILERVLIFCLYDFELGIMFELEEYFDRGLEFSLIGFFNNYVSLKLRIDFYEEEEEEL